MENRRNILVVDDDYIQIKVMKWFLEKLWNKDNVEYNNSAIDAVRRIIRKRFDLIFLDVEMHIIDWFKIAWLIRDICEWRNEEFWEVMHDDVKNNNPEIVMITWHPEYKYKDKIEEYNITKFLQKPVKFEDIAKILN